MSKTLEDKIMPEKEHMEGNCLPRADEWGSHSNSNAMGFEAIDSFHRISGHNNQISRISSHYPQALSNSNTLMLPISFPPQETENLYRNHYSQQNNSFSENSSTMVLQSQNSNTFMATPPQNSQSNTTPEDCSHYYQAKKSQEMVQEPQKEESKLQPIFNIEEVVDLCTFVGIDSNFLLRAYSKLRSVSDPQDYVSYIGDWLNANEVKGMTIAKTQLELAQAVKRANDITQASKMVMAIYKISFLIL